MVTDISDVSTIRSARERRGSSRSLSSSMALSSDRFLLETNNRSYLTVAIGCTGGKHRSVYIAEQLADYFRSRGKNVQSRHRTLEKRKS